MKASLVDAVHSREEKEKPENCEIQRSNPAVPYPIAELSIISVGKGSQVKNKKKYRRAFSATKHRAREIDKRNRGAEQHGMSHRAAAH